MAASTAAAAKYRVGDKVRMGNCRTGLGNYTGRMATVREVRRDYAEIDPTTGAFRPRGLHVDSALLEGSSNTIERDGDRVTISNQNGSWAYRECGWVYGVQVWGEDHGTICGEKAIAGRA